MAPEGTLALKYYRNLIIDHIQARLTFICSLNSNHTFLVASLDKARVVEECLGDQGTIVFREGTAMHEHHWTKCIDVMGDYIENSEKLSGLCHPCLDEAENFLNYPRNLESMVDCAKCNDFCKCKQTLRTITFVSLLL